MKFTIAVESDQERSNFDPDHFSRDEYLEKAVVSASAEKESAKQWTTDFRKFSQIKKRSMS